MIFGFLKKIADAAARFHSAGPRDVREGGEGAARRAGARGRKTLLVKVGNFEWKSQVGAGILWFGMMKRETITIADIYVPTKRRGTLEQKRVDEIAASILDKGLQAPILVRADGARFVLVEGLHRLEAAKALGEQTIVAFLVDARKH